MQQATYVRYMSRTLTLAALDSGATYFVALSHAQNTSHDHTINMSHESLILLVSSGYFSGFSDFSGRPSIDRLSGLMLSSCHAA